MTAFGCSITGMSIKDPGDGIYDHGEWISWEWIKTQLLILWSDLDRTSTSEHRGWASSISSWTLLYACPAAAGDAS